MTTQTQQQLPPITIVMTTWAPIGPVGESRRESASLALISWRDRLRYEGQLRLCISDDGSTLEKYPEDLGEIAHWDWTLSCTRQ